MYKTNGEKIEKIRQWAQDKTTKASKPYQEVIEIQ
jgi:hypothetical protein